MVWGTISPKSGNSSPPEMYCEGKIDLLLVKLTETLIETSKLTFNMEAQILGLSPDILVG